MTGSLVMAAASAAAMSRISCEIFIEQYFGPHMLQKWALLNVSCGSVSSWYFRAVSGSSDSRNYSFQSKANRARDRASSRTRAFFRCRARSAAWAAIL